MSKVKVFISYSHEDRAWVEDWLLPRLEGAGLEVCIDFRDFTVGRPGVFNMEDAVENCDNTLLVLTPHWLESQWANFESLIVQVGDPTGLKKRILPLMLKECELPRRLSILTYADFRNEGNWEPELSRLLNQLGITVPPPGHGEEGPEKISTSGLPSTGPNLFGREEQLRELDDAWGTVNIDIVTLVAWGGVGKTTLVRHWLNRMKEKHYCGARRVYGWSFYSQGVEDKQASADEFMQETLDWFGDPDPTAGSARNKGQRLAELIREERTLLILDGMEPLQYPPRELDGFAGRLKDQGLRTFLKELADGHPGLCIITTRESVMDLVDRNTVKEMELEHLSEEAGIQLLRSLMVTGPGKDIADAVREYEGHALALTLLGQYVRSVYRGDICQRDQIPQTRQANWARGLMEAYERWLGDSPRKDILYIMGLFDRPAPMGAIEALKADPPIHGVTDQLHRLSEEDWRLTLTNLRSINLLAQEQESNQRTEEEKLDCHPLIRGYFGQKLKEQNPEGWKEAHKRLYHYYKDLPEEELPDTLEEMEPLFAAVVHGCQAGLHQETLVNVFWKRIRRENEGYNVHKLGAFGADLAALSNFFKVLWSQPADQLTDEDKALVLSWAGYGLRALGKLQEAVQRMKKALENHIEMEDWIESSRDANNLSELMLILGEVNQGVKYARQSVEYADLTGEWEQGLKTRTTLAHALHHSGQWKEAEIIFQEAEAIQEKNQPEYPILYLLHGFRYCDFLLDKGAYEEVRERINKLLEWHEPSDPILGPALENLIAGRAWMTQVGEGEEGTDEFSRAMDSLDKALEGLRKAGYQEHLIRGLLARAEGYRKQKEYAKAHEDLEEAKEIAEMCGMKLFLADYHLEAGRLCQVEGNDEEVSKNHFMTAAQMINEMGYHRRDIEIEQIFNSIINREDQI